MCKNMKGNGLEPDTLDGVISALENVRDKWQNNWNCLEYPDLRDAIMYLKRYKHELEKPQMDKLIEVLRVTRGEI